MRRPIGLVLAAMVAGMLGSRALALEPKEVGVIYNTKSGESQRLATFYMKARGIPEGNLMPLITAVGENTTDEDYRRHVVPQVQGWLKDRPGLKCLVTTYDVPLKIGAYQPGMAERQEVNQYKARLEAILGELDEAVGSYQRLAGGTAATQATAPADTQATTAAKKAEKRTWIDEVKKLNPAATAAVARIEALKDSEKPAALGELARLQERVAGIHGLVSGFHVREGVPANDPSRQQIERLQAQLKEIDQTMKELIKDKNDPAARQKMVALQRTSHGLVGEARQIEETIAFLQPAETESCFDNELALVMAEQDYPRGRWVINPMNIELFEQRKGWPTIPRTILVTRLDGPTEPLVERMIETGIETEKQGLKGKMYLDARGLTSGPYSVFDVQLRELARWMKEHSALPVVLDDKPALFEAKDCPEAALYCGWYSLRNYQDSCQWVKGGVGYHVASGEMISLRDHPGKADESPAPEKGWVANLLKHGYCGTLGPTAEPYLSSFPNPAHFFPLLLCGEFTQGEVWEVTAPMLSWRTGYVGDPLYNPFKADPAVKVEAIRTDPVMRHAFDLLRAEAGTQPATRQ